MDVGSEARQLLGYVILDLRSIQHPTSSTTSHWYPLLNCSLAGDKPALRVTLATEEDKALEQRDSAGERNGNGPKEHDGNGPLPMGQLLLTLNDKGGYYQLGTPSQEDHLYTISVTLSNPHSLEAVCTCTCTTDSQSSAQSVCNVMLPWMAVCVCVHMCMCS